MTEFPNRVYDRNDPLSEGWMTEYDPEKHIACVEWDNGIIEPLRDVDSLGAIPRENWPKEGYETAN